MNPTPTQQRRKVKIRPLNMTTQKGVLVFMFGWLDGSDGCRGPEFREFFSEIWATVRCSENSVIFGRHAERSVTDEMSSFHSERLTPDNGQGEKDKEGRRGVADLTIFALRGSSAPLRQQ